MDENGLSDRQARFVEEYLKDLRAGSAAARAGYSPRSASQRAHKLMRNPRVKKAVDAAKAAHARAAGISRERVLGELIKLALADVRELFDEAGRPRPERLMDEHAAAAIGQVEFWIKPAKDGGEETQVKIKVRDRRPALIALAKHVGLFPTMADRRWDAEQEALRKARAQREITDEDRIRAIEAVFDRTGRRHELTAMLARFNERRAKA